MSHPELVAGQNWMAYAEPRDALTTTVHVNTDFPLDAYELIEFVTHEACPGHRAEHVLKSRLGRPELAAFVYRSRSSACGRSGSPTTRRPASRCAGPEQLTTADLVTR